MTQDTLYRLTIDGTEFNTTDATVKPEQLRRMAQLPAARLILILTPDSQARQVADGETIDLRGPQIEAFISRDPAPEYDQVHYRLEVDHELYETLSPTLRGQDIKALAGLEPTTPLHWFRHGQTEMVTDDQLVDLKAAGIEQFITAARPAAPQVTVTVTHTTTARTKTFQAQLSDSLHMVITEAYSKLKETARDGDSLFTGTDSRTDLRPLLHDTLQVLLDRGLLVQHPGLALHIDIDPAAGGA